VSGDERNTANDGQWYLLEEEMTGETVGYIDDKGNTRATTPDTAERVRKAFSRNLLIQGDDVVEELGICFDGICSVGPSDAEHDALVLRNLGALTGLRPATSRELGDDRDGTGE
jgi:hypothetical protein